MSSGTDAPSGVRIEATDGVLHLVIDRPHAKGAIDVTSQRQLVEALESAATDQDLRVVLLRSVGDDFCAGSDWVGANRGAERPRPGSLQRRTAVQSHRLIALLLEVQLPVVCAVRGWAAGLGCQMALAADFTIATESSRFWLPFSTRGFSADSGSTWLLPRLIGVARAKEMLLLGRAVSGAQAQEWGMVHRAVADQDLDAAVDGLVDELRRSATVAVGLTKRCIDGALDASMVEAMQAESLALELSSRTSDFKEGLAAFSERRDPDFQGR